MLSPIVDHTSVSEGVGGGGRDLTRQPSVKHQSHKQEPVWPRNGLSKGTHVKEHIPEKRPVTTRKKFVVRQTASSGMGMREREGGGGVGSWVMSDDSE